MSTTRKDLQREYTLSTFHAESQLKVNTSHAESQLKLNTSYAESKLKLNTYSLLGVLSIRSELKYNVYDMKETQKANSNSTLTLY
jgi:hypothetical protein